MSYPVSYPEIIGLMATSPEGVVGRAGGLPWHEPDDLEHFRRTIKGHRLVMGRKTFESMPSRLFEAYPPFVFSRCHPLQSAPRHYAVEGLEDFMRCASSLADPSLFMVGGADVAHLFLRANFIKTFILTRMHDTYEGDIVLDLRLLSSWSESVIQKTPRYTIVRLQKTLDLQ